MHAEKIDRAFEVQRISVEKFPRNGRSLMNLARMYNEQEKYEEALDTYRQTEAATDSHKYGHMIPVKIGMVQFKMGRYDLAEKAARNGGGCDDEAIADAAWLLKELKKAKADDANNAEEPATQPATQPVES